MTPQLVEYDVSRRIALQIDDDAHALAAGFVADVGHALNALVFGRFGNLLDKPGFANLKRYTGKDDRATVSFAFLNLMPGTLHDGALALAICRTRAASAEDQRASREIRGWDDVDQFIDRNRRIVDIGQAGLDYFAQIVRRNVGRHADGDTASAIDQKVRETGRENLRLFAAAVIVRLEIDSVLVEIVQKSVCDLVQARFGVTHRCWRIGVH